MTAATDSGWRNAVWLAGRGWRVTGVDFSEVALKRVHTLLVAAAARLTAGYPADEYLELARLACELPASHPDALIAASVRTLLERHARHVASDPPHRAPRVPGIHLIFVAAAVARTPWLPVPVPDPAALAHPVVPPRIDPAKR